MHYVPLVDTVTEAHYGCGTRSRDAPKGKRPKGLFDLLFSEPPPDFKSFFEHPLKGVKLWSVE